MHLRAGRKVVRSNVNLAIISDVHYASAAEQARKDYCYAPVVNPVQRLVLRIYRRFVWLHDPFAHNHLLDEFVAAAKSADYVIANGDYSCDSAFVGVSDDAACDSAAECLGKLRSQFGSRLLATIGDHELGKMPLGAQVGGLRLASLQRAERKLGLQRFWQIELGNYLLMGVASTLVALPVYERETLRDEIETWRKARALHLEEIRLAFSKINPSQRVLLFCHDPTALPFLLEQKEVVGRLSQIERTIIGHLHSNLVLFKSRFLRGMPVINFLGHTPRRLSAALRQARHWHPFNVLLCPSTSGIQLLKDGGYLTAELDLTGQTPARFQCHRLRWRR